MHRILLLIVGGSIGTLCRYFMAEFGQSKFGSWLPFGTLLVNITGCLIAGLLLGIFESRFYALTEAPANLRLFLFTGILGAFTTFSSYELEAFLYLRQGLWERALLYLLGSLLLGLGALALGLKVGQALPK